MSTSFETHHISRFRVTLEPKVIKIVLHAVKHGQPLPETALSDLRVVKAVIPLGLPKAVYDHLLIEWLANRIIYNLNTIRRIHNLIPAQTTDERETVLKQMQADFSQEDSHLEVWSLLYLSFVRVDIRITDKELATIALVSPRTLRRRRQRGYELLLIDITLKEINIKP